MKLFISTVMIACFMALAAPSMAQDHAGDMKVPEEVLVIVHHKVTDFDKWRPAFEKDAANREAAGCTGITVYQDPNDPTMVSAIATVASYEQALAFVQSEDLKQAMEAAGVVGQPDVHIVKKYKEYAH